jgi:hypothetical protein
MIVGRNLNTRLDDMSAIQNSTNPEKFFQRATTKDSKVLLDTYINNNFLPLYVIHEGLCNAHLMFHFYPGSKIINIQRDPVQLILSWYKRGWGTRFGTDPTSFSISFTSRLQPSPWFALDCIFTLTQFAKEEYELLTSKQKSQILFIDYYDLVYKPNDSMKILSQFVKRGFDVNVSKVVRSLGLPRQIRKELYQSELDFIKSKISEESLEFLRILTEQHKNYWNVLCKKA